MAALRRKPPRKCKRCGVGKVNHPNQHARAAVAGDPPQWVSNALQQLIWISEEPHHVCSRNEYNTCNRIRTLSSFGRNTQSLTKKHFTQLGGLSNHHAVGCLLRRGGLSRPLQRGNLLLLLLAPVAVQCSLEGGKEVPSCN